MKESFWRAKKYFNYKLFAKHRKGHGIHSPFVYNFIRNVLMDKKYYSDYDLIENYRKSLLNSKKAVEINDLGAGSKRMKTNSRKISDIVKNSSVIPKYGKLLYRLVKYFNTQSIVELGTSFGISTQYLALGNLESKVVSIESNYQLIDILKNYLNKNVIQNIKVVEGNFDETLPNVLKDIDRIDLAYIDGNHAFEPTLKYFNLLKEKCHNDSCLIFDDIYWSKEMNRAWEKIKQDEDIKATIDLFQFGIVFFRKEMSKENFIIKY